MIVRMMVGLYTTCVDIPDKDKVPIFFSVEQMRHLRMNIEHAPAGEILTCPFSGMQRTALRSVHPIIQFFKLETHVQL